MFALAIITLALISGVVQAQNLPNSRVVPDVCNSTYACAATDSKWPTTSFNCEENRVSSFSLNVVTQLGILAGSGDVVDTSASLCSDTSSNATLMSYDQGRYSVHYTMATVCNCGVEESANCTAADTIDNTACNFATFSFCGIEMDSKACTAA